MTTTYLARNGLLLTKHSCRVRYKYSSQPSLGLFLIRDNMTKEPDVRVSDPKNSIPFPHVAVDTTASSVVEQRGKMHRSVILQASTFTGQENGYLDNVAAAVTGQGGGSGQSGSLTCTCTCPCFSVSPVCCAPLQFHLEGVSSELRVQISNQRLHCG